MIEYELNKRASRSYVEKKFGTKEAKYCKLPEQMSPGTNSNEWQQSLNEYLKSSHDATEKFQQERMVKRLCADKKTRAPKSILTRRLSS